MASGGEGRDCSARGPPPFLSLTPPPPTTTTTTTTMAAKRLSPAKTVYALPSRLSREDAAALGVATAVAVAAAERCTLAAKSHECPQGAWLQV